MRYRAGKTSFHHWRTSGVRGLCPEPSSRTSTRGRASVSSITSDNPTDGELVYLAKGGDEGAFGLLVERYQRPAYAVALSVTGRHEDAEDAAQEAFLVALNRLEKCRNPERFAGWLMPIVRNRSKNLVRRESLRETDQVPAAARSLAPTPDVAAETTELRDFLGEALRDLPEVQRQIVLLHDVEGWKHREIADRLDLPSGTVRSHLHFARKALRRALESVPWVPEMIREVQ